MRIEGIQPGNPVDKSQLVQRVDPNKPAASFKETLATFLEDVNKTQKSASDAQLKFLSGEINDVHEVMRTSEEGKTAFNMLMELRNKTLDGYHELMRIRL